MRFILQSFLVIQNSGLCIRFAEADIMDKRKEENLRVKQSIVRALFSLMQEKSLADIHITELVNSAGVARASFYRNSLSVPGRTCWSL